MDGLETVSNNLIDIIYHLHNSLKLDIRNAETKQILTKVRLTLRDLEKIKDNLFASDGV